MATLICPAYLVTKSSMVGETPMDAAHLAPKCAVRAHHSKKLGAVRRVSNGEPYPLSYLTMYVPLPETCAHCSLHVLESFVVLESMTNFFVIAAQRAVFNFQPNDNPQLRPRTRIHEVRAKNVGAEHSKTRPMRHSPGGVFRGLEVAISAIDWVLAHVHARTDRTDQSSGGRFWEA